MKPLFDTSKPVAVVAPCGAFGTERLAEGLRIAREHGINVQPLDGIDRRHRYLAGPDDHRAAQLTQAMTDPQYGAVWVARGGYGMTRILSALDLGAMQRRPLIGFSDVTALMGPMAAHGIPLVHGPVVHSLPITDAPSLHHLFSLLHGRPVDPLIGTPWRAGSTHGRLVGGNLSLLAATCGTPWQLDTRGAILVLEEVGERPYRVDRLLQQLASAGLLDDLAGVALGQFEGCSAPDDATYHLDDVLRDAFLPLNIPIVADLPIGHGAANRAFPWGTAGWISEDRLGWGLSLA